MALGPVGQIHISVTNIDDSVAFYRDVLGIPFLFQVPNMPMAFFASGDVRLYLGVPENEEFRSRVTFCRDPDGHQIGLMQERPAPAPLR
jgi:catechol 2,3-dioxygenase-like lactoylglutathione lyase family enzyme